MTSHVSREMMARVTQCCATKYSFKGSALNKEPKTVCENDRKATCSHRIPHVLLKQLNCNRDSGACNWAQHCISVKIPQ
eukprot:1966026-Amphidinium_carterae.1